MKCHSCGAEIKVDVDLDIPRDRFVTGCPACGPGGVSVKTWRAFDARRAFGPGELPLEEADAVTAAIERSIAQLEKRDRQ